MKGRYMTDSYLVKVLSAEEPQVSKVYKQTSGYVHLSEKHIFNATRLSSDDKRTLELRIGCGDPFVPDNLYLEAIEAFKATTDLLFRYINGWIFTKDNPEVVKKHKKDSEKETNASEKYYQSNLK